MIVLEVLTKNNIKFSEIGHDYLVHCLNPEHDDKTPSLRIDKENGKFQCFSCGFKGNIFSFFNLTPPVVYNNIRELTSIIDDLISDSTPIELPFTRESFDIDYRGISGNTFKHFQAFTEETLYPNRLVFPIYDSTNKLVATLSRLMHSEVKKGKYIVYPKKVGLPIYPLHSNSVCILVEGLFDVINLYDKGITNVSALFGTHSISDRTLDSKILPLTSRGASVILVLLDNDAAGRSRSETLVRELNRLNILAINITDLLPEGSDPGSLDHSQVLDLKKNINTILDLEYKLSI